MKTAQRKMHPALSYLEAIFTGTYAIIQAVLSIIRDVLKGIYLFFLQLFTRLFYIEREYPSSISLSARLDVIPRRSHLGRHKLFVARRALIEASSVICTWHGDVILKEGASIGIGSVVIGPVKMGEGSICSQNCFIGGQSHIFEDVSKSFLRQGLDIKQVIIGKNVWIGANVVILLGVKIGDNSVIGAGSTVVKDIPPYSVAVGNPAKVVKRYNFKTEQWEPV
jgi:acetyltransferase-like isoleucine patch superfamily enzyme